METENNNDVWGIMEDYCYKNGRHIYPIGTSDGIKKILDSSDIKYSGPKECAFKIWKPRRYRALVYNPQSLTKKCKPEEKNFLCEIITRNVYTLNTSSIIMNTTKKISNFFNEKLKPYNPSGFHFVHSTKFYLTYPFESKVSWASALFLEQFGDGVYSENRTIEPKDPNFLRKFGLETKVNSELPFMLLKAIILHFNFENENSK